MFPNCPTATVTDVTVTQTGSAVFTATELHRVRDQKVRLHLQHSRLLPARGNLRRPRRAFGQSPTLASSSCTGSATCVCPLVYAPVSVRDSGTYTTSGNMLNTTQSSGTSAPSSYCVEGDRLHLLDVQTITNMGLVTMRTRSDQVAQRRAARR